MSSPSQTVNVAQARPSHTSQRHVNHMILRALVGLATAALLVRVCGLVSQIAITSRFGAGAAMDAYIVAASLPILVAQLLAGGMEASVIPMYARLRNQTSRDYTTVVFSTIVNLFVVGLAVLTLAMLLLHRQLIFLTAPALDPYRAGLAVQLAPLIIPVLLLMGTTGLLECVLNTEGQFGWPAHAALLVPLATAVIVLVIGERIGVAAIAIGTLAGCGLQLGMLVYRLRLAGICYRPVLNWHLPEVGLVLVAASPALLGALVNQASPLVDQIFASFLSAGSISALSYATKISSLATGIVFVAVGRAALPYLSRQAASQDIAGFRATLRLYLWVVGLVTAAMSVGMLVLAHPLVQILFQRGAFSPEDTSRTAVTLMGLAVGLVPMGLGFLLARAFSALGKNHVLMYVTIFSVIANAGFDYALARYWQSFGIALATSMVYCCTLVILLVVLRRHIGGLDLLTPPQELIHLSRRLVTGELYQTLLAWKDDNLSGLRLPRRLRLPLLCLATAVLALAAGVAVPHLNTQLSLRLAVGLPLILLLLRYRFALLVAWILVGALVGSSLPVFKGNNFDTALTVPTLLLLVTLPMAAILKRMPVLALLFLYLIWVFAGIGRSPLGSADFLKTWLLYLTYASVAALAVCVVSTQRRLQLIVDALLVVGAFIALYGIAGHFTQQNVLVDPMAGDVRILSIFTAAPTLALMLSLIIPLALYRALASRGLARYIALIVLFVALVALVLTYSRGAFLSVPVSFAIAALFLPSPRLRVGLLGSIIGLAVLAVVLAGVTHASVFARFSGQDVASLNGRTYLWQALLEHLGQQPFLGNGLGAATAVLTTLSIGANGVSGNGLLATAPSNLYISTLYDTGIVGLVLLAVTLTLLGCILVIGARRATGEHRLLFVMVLVVLINTLIQSIEQDDFWAQGIALYFWVTMALPFAACWVRVASAAEVCATAHQEQATYAAQAEVGHEVAVDSSPSPHVGFPSPTR